MDLVITAVVVWFLALVGAYLLDRAAHARLDELELDVEELIDTVDSLGDITTGHTVSTRAPGIYDEFNNLVFGAPTPPYSGAEDEPGLIKTLIDPNITHPDLDSAITHDLDGTIGDEEDIPVSTFQPAFNNLQDAPENQ